MLRTTESETEILLGNKQLLGIFFVVAILLGIAFTGGYIVGRSSIDKKATSSSTPSDSSSSTPAKPNTAAETHSVAPDSSGTDASNAPSVPGVREPASQRTTDTSASPDAPLGSPKRGAARRQATGAEGATTGANNNFSPEKGQTFLQVAAVTQDEAQGIADVLHKKGFEAHAVPKPGTSNIYRVLIGPIRDPGDLSSTRDSLRKTGFREVIVQHY